MVEIPRDKNKEVRRSFYMREVNMARREMCLRQGQTPVSF